MLYLIQCFHAVRLRRLIRTRLLALLCLASILPAAAAAPVLAKGAVAPEFAGIDQWLGSPPLTMEQLRGKVVLVDFWTYSCINCLRTLPYVAQWHAKYKERGLVVVGVHTPEFPFERSSANVRTAMTRFGVTWPVAQDNRYATWAAYRNQYWPAVYLIDRTGRIVHTHAGEGQYAETAAVIERLLGPAAGAPAAGAPVAGIPAAGTPATGINAKTAPLPARPAALQSRRSSASHPLPPPGG